MNMGRVSVVAVALLEICLAGLAMQGPAGLCLRRNMAAKRKPSCARDERAPRNVANEEDGDIGGRRIAHGVPGLELPVRGPQYGRQRLPAGATPGPEEGATDVGRFTHTPSAGAAQLELPHRNHTPASLSMPKRWIMGINAGMHWPMTGQTVG
jgi:hypothetical protein